MADQSLNFGRTSVLETLFPVNKELPAHLAELLGKLKAQERSDRAVTEMSDEEVQASLDDYFKWATEKLPNWFSTAIIWLRRPSRWLQRAVVGLLLLAGGLLWFLPVLGAWMLPLGLLILSQDIPILQRPLLAAFRWTIKKWDLMGRGMRRLSSGGRYHSR